MGTPKVFFLSFFEVSPHQLPVLVKALIQQFCQKEKLDYLRFGSPFASITKLKKRCQGSAGSAAFWWLPSPRLPALFAPPLQPSGGSPYHAFPLSFAWRQLQGAMIKRKGVQKFKLDKVSETRIIDMKIMALETGKQSNQG